MTFPERRMHAVMNAHINAIYLPGSVALSAIHIYECLMLHTAPRTHKYVYHIDSPYADAGRPAYSDVGIFTLYIRNYVAHRCDVHSR